MPLGAKTLSAFLHDVNENATLDVFDSTSNPSFKMKSTQALASLAEGLQKHKGIRKLILADCDINDAGCEILSQILAVNHTIEELNLENNKITGMGAGMLADGLARNMSVKTLNLLQQAVKNFGDACLSKFVQMFETNVTLTKIKWNAVTSWQTSFMLANLQTRNIDITKRITAGKDYQDLMSGIKARSSPSTPKSKPTLVAILEDEGDEMSGTFGGPPSRTSSDRLGSIDSAPLETTPQLDIPDSAPLETPPQSDILDSAPLETPPSPSGSTPSKIKQNSALKFDLLDSLTRAGFTAPKTISRAKSGYAQETRAPQQVLPERPQQVLPESQASVSYGSRSPKSGYAQESQAPKQVLPERPQQVLSESHASGLNGSSSTGSGLPQESRRRKAREEAERKAREEKLLARQNAEAAKRLAQKEEAERKSREEEDLARQHADVAEKLATLGEDAARKAREEEELARQTAEVADRLAKKEEALRKAREEAERKAKEQEELARTKYEAAERLANKLEAERKAREHEESVRRTSVAVSPSRDLDEEPAARELLDFYTVGDQLGEGAFGVVYACHPHDQDLFCAVKMVDKVETPMAIIMDEVQFMRKFRHPHVIRCHDVFYEKCFVCIVMDRFQSNVADGMLLHWEEKGTIPIAATTLLAAQMGSSIHYIHSLNIVHRDVKCDNYMIDVEDISDLSIRVVLIDFGTALKTSQSERLSEMAGTERYWSPEFWKQDYSFKVDIWALGVVLYTLLFEEFPFEDEDEVHANPLTIPKKMSRDWTKLVKLLLDKNEATRGSAEEIVSHPVLVGRTSEIGAKAMEAAKKEQEAAEAAAAARGAEAAKAAEAAQAEQARLRALEEEARKDAGANAAELARLEVARKKAEEEERARRKDVEAAAAAAAKAAEAAKAAMEKAKEQMKAKQVQAKSKRNSMDSVWTTEDEKEERLNAFPLDCSFGSQVPTGSGLSSFIFKEGGADIAVKARRIQLVSRLVSTRTDSVASQRKETILGPQETNGSTHAWKESFNIMDMLNNNGWIRYEWLAQASLSKECSASAKDAGWMDAGTMGGASLVRKQLRDHGIDTTLFGKGTAKTLASLAAEVETGSCELMLDATEHKKLVRVVQTVAVRLCQPAVPGAYLGDAGYLIEIKEKFLDGREREIRRLPNAKKLPHENTKQVVERCVIDYFSHLSAFKIDFDFSNSECFEEECESPSYPGVKTVYRTEIVEGKLKPLSSVSSPTLQAVSNGRFQTDYEFDDEGCSTVSKVFKWLTRQQCDSDGIKYKVPKKWSFSALVHAPIGVNERDLRALLSKHKVDVSKFGQGKTKTLQAFSAELLKGEATLIPDADGGIVRVVEQVLLKLINSENGAVLVQTDATYADDTKVELNRLPGAKRRPDENVFFAAKTILREGLMIVENDVNFSGEVVDSVEEEFQSLSYPGLRTLYRKRIVTGWLSR